MAQVRYGIRKILEKPILYSFLQKALGAERNNKMIIRDHLDLKPHSRILDVGCGPADILEYMPQDVTYFGFDLEASYIEKAKDRFHERGTFIRENVTTFNFHGEKFDRILISGLLHHLEDNEIRKMFFTLKELLAEDGYVFCIENTYVPDQSLMAKRIIALDRGKNVRTPQGYLCLCEEFFSKVTYSIHHDLLRIPYTHIFIKCAK